MPLRSHGMALTGPERSWLPWFSAVGKLSMGWACWINNARYGQLEEIFDSLADTRMRLLQQWCDNQWTTLQSISRDLEDAAQPTSQAQLNKLKGKLADASELFLLDA